MDLKIKKYINKLLNLNWKNYKLYLVGGALQGWQTKDIDICILGPLDEKKIFDLMEKARSIGPFDIFYIKDELKSLYEGPFTVQFAKSYDRCCPSAMQRKGEWINGLFWQELTFPMEKHKNREYNKQPLLIYDGTL